MKCEEARHRWHTRFDDGCEDPKLEDHLAGCDDCRCYVAHLAQITGALGELRRGTESIVSDSGSPISLPAQRLKLWPWHVPLRRVVEIAAYIVIVVGASMYITTQRRAAGPVVAPDKLVDTGADSWVPDVLEGRVGLTLRGETAERFIAVARAAPQANVQVFWLYPTLDVNAGSTPNGSTQ